MSYSPYNTPYPGTPNSYLGGPSGYSGSELNTIGGPQNNQNPFGNSGGIFGRLGNQAYNQVTANTLSTNGFDLNPNGDKYASNLNSWIHTQEYNDYQRRFRPIEDELIGSVDNPEVMQNAMDRTRSNVDQGFGMSEGITKRAFERMGVEAPERDTNSRLHQAASKAQALNSTKRGILERDLQIMGGGLTPAAQTRLNQGN